MGQFRKTTTIPHAPTGRMLLAAGAKRVSADAMDAFSEVIHDIALKIAKNAAQVSRHAGRKTVHDSDIKLAAKQQ